MNILSIETCSNKLSVAVSKNKNIKSFIFNDTDQSQAESLILLIEEILEKNSLNYKDIDYLALTKGPGSFTGVRVGLAYANALKLSTNIKIITISTLEIIACKMFSQANNFDYYVPVFRSTRNEIYVQIFDKNKNSITDIKIINSKEIIEFLSSLDGKIAVGGSIFEILPFINQLKKLTFLPRFPYPDSATICRRAYELVIKKTYDCCLEPYYLKQPDAKIGKNSKLL